jgi:predicted aspartyl protease
MEVRDPLWRTHWRGAFFVITPAGSPDWHLVVGPYSRQDNYAPMPVKLTHTYDHAWGECERWNGVIEAYAPPAPPPAPVVVVDAPPAPPPPPAPVVIYPPAPAPAPPVVVTVPIVMPQQQPQPAPMPAIDPAEICKGVGLGFDATARKCVALVTPTPEPPPARFAPPAAAPDVPLPNRAKVMPKPQPPLDPPTAGSAKKDTVPLIYAEGSSVAKIDVLFGSQPLRMTIDTGASESAVPVDLARRLVEAGEAEWLNPRQYKIADGSIVTQRRVKIRRISIGSHVITDITASAGNGEPLLGFDILNIVGSFTINTREQQLEFNA